MNSSKKVPEKEAISGRLGVIGVQEISNIDQLAKLYEEFGEEARVPCRLVVDVLVKELSSSEFRSFMKTIPFSSEEVSLKTMTVLVRAVPQRLYFFLWSLRNSEALPISGILTSEELRQGTAALVRFLGVLEGLPHRSSNSIPLFENLGFTYFDLAGIAGYTQKGLYLNGRYVDYTVLLRNAISAFQCAIKLSAEQGRNLDATHLDILHLVDEQIELRENRANLYLNPWHFLYISAALHLLNDDKMAEMYLAKARSILNSLESHQNPKLVTQKELLESIYTTIHFGKTVQFDFDETNLVKLEKKLNKLRKQKNQSSKRPSYSPMVEAALAQEFHVQREMRTLGTLQSDQRLYLNGVHALYQQKLSPLERDKIIFRLNIPPVKIKGLHSGIDKVNAYQLPPQGSEQKSQMKLVMSKTYRAAS